MSFDVAIRFVVGWSGTPHEYWWVPLTNETIRYSPATHLHPVESITSYNGSIGDKPMDIDGKNEECDIDTESICQMADLLWQSYTDLVFLGDKDSCPTKSPVISELCDLYGLHNLIDQPTCFKGATSSVIDVILVTNRKKYSGVLNCNYHISDVHNFIGAATRRYAPLRKPRHIFYRSYTNFDDAEFFSAVSSTPFHVCEIFDDIEDMAWFTSSLLSTIINEHASMKRKLVKQESVPYMNLRLRKAMYRRNMARNKFRLYGKQYWHENRRQRNLVVSLRKQSLTKYFSEKCSKKR